jgi:excisionase family DNA binding protein
MVFKGIVWRLMANWLDLDELAVYLKMPKSTLYKLAQRGELPGHKVGKAWRFDRDEVDEHIKAGAKRSSGRADEDERTRVKPKSVS